MPGPESRRCTPSCSPRARPRPKRPPDERKLVTRRLRRAGGHAARTPRTCARRTRGCARSSRASAPPSTIRRWPSSACPPRTRTIRSGPCARRCRRASSGWRRAPGVATGEAIVSGTAPRPERSRPPPSGCSGRPRAGATLADEATVHATRGALDFESVVRRLVGPRGAAAPRRPAPRAAGRPRVRAGGARGPVRARRRRAPPAPRDRRRPRRDRQEPAGGRVRRRPSRPLPAVRRGHHVLGAARDPHPRRRDRARRQRGGRGGQAAGAGRGAGRRRGRARDGRARRQRRHRARRARARGAVAGVGGGGDRPGVAAAAERAGARRRRDRGPALGRAAAARPGRGDRRPLRRPAAAGRHRPSGAGRGAARLGLPAGDVAGRAPAAERRRDAAAGGRAAPGARRGAAAAGRAQGGGQPVLRRGARAPRRVRRQPGEIPTTVRALLAARIDALPAIERRVLRHASVVGRTFWPPALDADIELGPPLRALEARGFVVPRAASALPGHTELAFVHGLTREVAYHSIPRADRCRTHAAVARWIEARVGDRREEFVELLAYHYEAAARPADAALAWPDEPAEREAVRAAALRALVDAGDAARRRMAIDQAVRFADRALALAATDAERLPGAGAEGPQLPRRGARRRRARRVHRGDRASPAGSATAPRRRACAASRSCSARATAARSARPGWVDRRPRWSRKASPSTATSRPASPPARCASAARGACASGRRTGSCTRPARSDEAQRDAERAVEIAEEIGSSLLLALRARGPDVALVRRGSPRRRRARRAPAARRRGPDRPGRGAREPGRGRHVLRPRRPVRTGRARPPTEASQQALRLGRHRRLHAAGAAGAGARAVRRVRRAADRDVRTSSSSRREGGHDVLGRDPRPRRAHAGAVRGRRPRGRASRPRCCRSSRRRAIR